MSHVNRFGDADLADRSGPEYAWMDRATRFRTHEWDLSPDCEMRNGQNAAPLDRQQLGRLMADLEDAVVDKLRRGYRVNLFGVLLHA